MTIALLSKGTRSGVHAVYCLEFFYHFVSTSIVFVLPYSTSGNFEYNYFADDLSLCFFSV